MRPSRSAAPSQWRLGHRPSLDGIRGVAVLLVLLGHFRVLPEDAATVGVGLFFTLSGYLITALLLDELAERDRIDLVAFYIRRARRLLPALVLLLVCLAAVHAVAGDLVEWLRGTWPVLVYAGNWGYLAAILPHDLGHTWSLAIEEQFYLLWPAALVLLVRSRRALEVAVTLASLSALTVLPWYPDMQLAFYGSPQRAQELLAGAAVVLLAHRLGRDPRPSILLAALGLAVVVPSALLPGFGRFGTLTLTIPLAVVVAGAAAGPGSLSWRPLIWTGRISYGLYLYHYPLIGLAWWPVLIAATYALAIASWLLVERQLLRRRAVGGIGLVALDSGQLAPLR